MIRLLVLILALCAPAALAQDERIVLGLSETRVAITADFQGSQIMIYGAVQRYSPEPDGDLGVIVTVSGPPTQVMVRKKERRLGIWINREKVRIGRAPSFYAVATSGPIGEVLSATDNLRYKITIRARSAPSASAHRPRMRRASSRRWSGSAPARTGM